MRTIQVKSIRTRIIILLLMAVLPLAAASVVWDYTEKSQIRKHLVRDAKLLAESAISEQDMQIEQVRAFLTALSHSAQVRDASVGCDAYLRDVIEHYDDFRNIGVIGPDGKAACSALPYEGVVNLSDRAYFRRAVETRDFSVGDYQVGRITGKETINFGYPVLDSGGNVTSVVFAAVDIASLNERFVSTIAKVLPAGTTITEVDSAGTVLSLHPDPAGYTGTPVSGHPVLAKVLASGGDVVTTDGPDGAGRLYMVLPLYSRLEGGNINVVLGVPKDEVYAAADAMFTGGMATIAVVLALCITLAVKGSERYVIRNIDRLADTTRKISDGMLSTRTGMDYEDGELGQLARSVDDMAASLQERNDEIGMAMEIIRHAEARYRTLVEQVPSIAYTTPPFETSSPTYVSPQVEYILGYTPEELTSSPGSWDRLIHHADAGRVADEFKKSLEEGTRFTSEYRAHAKDGRIVWLHDESSMVTGDDGSPLMCQGIMIDITERKRRELELVAIATLSSELRKAHRVEDMPDILLRCVMELLNARCAAFAYAAGGAEGMTITHAHGGCDDWVGLELVTCEERRKLTIDKGEPCVFRDAGQDPMLAGNDMVEELASSISSPLVFHGHTTGALWVGLTGEITEDDLRVIRAVCDIAANAIHREKLFEVTENRLERLYALRAIDMAITSSMDLGVVLNVALDQVVSQLKVDAADILLLNEHDNILRYTAGRGFLTQSIRATSLPLGQGVAGKAALERRVIAIDDIDRYIKDFSRAGIFREENIVSVCCVPLTAKGKVKGVLEVFNRTPSVHDAEWLEFLEALGMQIAIAVDNAELFIDLQRSHTELQLSYDATIEGWARALDYRDRETEGHSRRVTDITVEMARAFGMADEELVHVRRGALMHDIGKLGVPDNILLKPGPLSEDEWAVMKRHPELAYKLLHPIAYLRTAIDIPYSHHEKWDGSGYPKGLKGDQIPLAARIFAVVDVWDALLSDRPYRGAWTEDKVRSYIESQRGIQFDPDVVTEFLNLDWGKFRH